MWFKNLVVFRLLAPWTSSGAELEERLAGRPLRPCNGYELFTRGWVPASPAGRLVHSFGNQHLLEMGQNQKLLPASIVNQASRERVTEVAAEQGFPVGRRQRREIRDRVADELRARAFTRRSQMRAWVDADRQRLIVDAATPARAETVAESLRETLGSLPLVPLETARSPATSMGAWLGAGDAPGHFRLEQDLELQAIRDARSKVRYVSHPLELNEVRRHLAGGKHATRLALSWSDRLAFVLTAEGQVKRIQYLGLTRDDAPADGEGNADEKFEADFALMTGEIGRMLDELIEALGGIAVRDESLAAA